MSAACEDFKMEHTWTPVRKYVALAALPNGDQPGTAAQSRPHSPDKAVNSRRLDHTAQNLDYHLSSSGNPSA